MAIARSRGDGVGTRNTTYTESQRMDGNRRDKNINEMMRDESREQHGTSRNSSTVDLQAAFAHPPLLPPLLMASVSFRFVSFHSIPFLPSFIYLTSAAVRTVRFRLPLEV